MLKANGFLAVRVALVMGLVLICLLWAAAKSGEGQIPSVDGPDGLRKEGSSAKRGKIIRLF
ncbi:MAG: hypothetical protein GX748_06590 [Lentisphaerae bacterium]|nr:hypothetical protein [Lentisphaerota bacterium]